MISVGAVKRFMSACNQELPHTPEITQTTLLYRGLRREEFLELENAIAHLDSLMNFSTTPPSEEQLLSALAEVLDGQLDVIWTTIGEMVSMGLPAIGGWDEVVRSNMEKVGADGKVHYREDGKVLKPDGWRGPDLEGLLRMYVQAHGEEG